jgi:hypothetical protein
LAAELFEQLIERMTHNIMADLERGWQAAAAAAASRQT